MLLMPDGWTTDMGFMEWNGMGWDERKWEGVWDEREGKGRNGRYINQQQSITNEHTRLASKQGVNGWGGNYPFGGNDV